MEDSKKRSADSAKSGSPKKQRVSKKGGDGKGKKKKDSNKPKRAPSAYIYYVKQLTKELQQKNENGDAGKANMKIGDVAKLAGAKWKTMSDEEKKPYFDMHEKAKKAYEQKLNLYKPPRDKNKPKKPPTGFFYFLRECREVMKDVDGKRVPSLAGEKWRAMSDGEKEKYVSLAKAAKKEYDEQMKEYLAKNPPQKAQRSPKKSKVQVKEDSSEDEDDEEDEEVEENDDEEEEEEDEEEDDEEEESD